MLMAQLGGLRTKRPENEAIKEVSQLHVRFEFCLSEKRVFASVYHPYINNGTRCVFEILLCEQTGKHV